jgi:hypothetical protein
MTQGRFPRLPPLLLLRRNRPRQPPQLGENATELVHIGQAVIDHGGSVEYFRDAVFNYPTLAEAYKVTALDGLNRIA